MPENQKTKTREEFLLEMDEILGLRAGTLRGNENLDELQNWDSTALIGIDCPGGISERCAHLS